MRKIYLLTLFSFLGYQLALASCPISLNVFVTDVTCINGFGSLQIDIANGTAPFDITFNGTTVTSTDSTYIFDELASGTYDIEVVDANSCTEETTITIVEPSPLLVTVNVPTLTCANANICVDVVVAGGTAPYLYSFNGITVPSGVICDIFMAGVYVVTVTDANGCTESITFIVDESEPIAFDIDIVDISACGANDGVITITPTGGEAPFSYLWDSQINTPTATGLAAGIYWVSVTDAANCFAVAGPIILDNPCPLEISASTISNVSCFGGIDGAIDLTIEGGLPVYTALWSNGVTTPNVTNLSAGTYTVTVTDAVGNIFVSTYTVGEAEELVLNLDFSSSSCLGDAMASTNVEGGTPSYAYIWSNGENTPSVSNLIAGNYSVSVFDNNNCVVAEDFTIASPIDLEVTSTLTDCNTDNGTATATVLGGAVDPLFAWSNGTLGATNTDLSPGWYSVTVTDQGDNCQLHKNVEVLEDPICFVIISGTVYLETLETDCVVDSETFGVSNIYVELSDGQIVYTDLNGYYEFTTDAGTYDVSIQFNDNIFEALCTDPITVDAATWGSTYGDNNFYLEYGEDRDIQLKIYKQNARPGFQQSVNICLMNVGAVPISGTVTFVHPDLQSYTSSFPEATNYDEASHTLTWDYDNIPPNTTWVYKTLLLTPIGTALGTELTYNFIADPIAGDLTPENNEKTCSLLVTGSFDPNDKQVVPAGEGINGDITLADSLLSYRVRFQNTGTDTAFTVLIRDTLDADLDIRTLVPGASSHSYTASIKEGRVLELLFENIMLPDSFVNEPASNGFVIFDIEIKDNPSFGTRIENRAGIYFDFNPPVITNTVVNTVQMITSLDVIETPSYALELSPNPFNETSRLTYQLKESEALSLHLYDLAGKKMNTLFDQKQHHSGNHEISIQDLKLAAGIYFLQLIGEAGRVESLRMIKFNE